MPGDHDVLLLGATGLVGGLALPLLLQRAEREGFLVHAPCRRALDVTHGQLRPLVADAGSAAGLSAIEDSLQRQGRGLGSFVCAIGTTLRAAGSPQAFAAVDRDLVLAAAALAQRLGARQALLVSSVGASARSSNLYLRVKGEMEDAVVALGFERVDCLQPGLLLGARGGQARPGERVAQLLAPLFNPLLRGPLRQYGAIAASTVAAALSALTGRPGNGVHRYDNRKILERSTGFPPAPE